MRTNVTPKRETIELCTLNPGDVFIPSGYEDDGYIYMVVNTCSADGVCLDFDEDSIVSICLNDGEVTTFNNKDLGFKVKGTFEGEY